MERLCFEIGVYYKERAEWLGETEFFRKNSVSLRHFLT